MPRPRLPEAERRSNYTLALPNWMIEELKAIPGVRKTIETMIAEQILKKKNK